LFIEDQALLLLYDLAKRGGARHGFSLAWLVAEGNLSDGGLSRLMVSGSRKVIINNLFSIIMHNTISITIYII